MTKPSAKSPRARTTELFLWALAAAGAGLVLAFAVRLVPSPAIHTAGLMFLPLLLPVVAALAVLSIVFGAIALVRQRRRDDKVYAPIIVPMAASALLVFLLPVLVLLAQVLVALAGFLVGG